MEPKILRVTNLHLDWIGGDEHRANQIMILTDYLKGQPVTDYEIIAGDFNSLGLFNRQKKTEAIQALLPDGFQNIFSEPYATLPPQQLDYIFTKGFTAVSGSILKIPGSDHFPINAELVIDCDTLT